MKRVKCISGLTAVKVGSKIINFSINPTCPDGSVVTEDRIAAKLMKMGGYEIIPDSTLKPDPPSLRRHVRRATVQSKKVGWFSKAWKLVSKKF